jgi:hypothetical protein
MKFEYLNTPFPHTIIRNYFSDEEIENIITEKNDIITNVNPLELIPDHDFHHKNLVNINKTFTFDLDRLYSNRREDSNILRCTRKIFTLSTNCSLNFKLNNYLKYIPLCRKDSSFLNVYKDGSYYDAHIDLSTLTVLSVVWDTPVEVPASDHLYFYDYDYSPNLYNNSCIIFPSYEVHGVKKINCSLDSQRITINQRLYVV